MLNFSLFNKFRSHDNASELFRLCQFIVLMFAIILVEINKFPLFISTDRVLEQWSTLLPNFFIGKQDFLFSYGPLYWLQGNPIVQYSKESYFISLFFISFYCAVSWALIFRLGLKFKSIIFVAVVYGLFLKLYHADAVFFTLPLFAIIYLRSNSLDQMWDNKLFLFCAGLFIAFLFYYRFFYGMIGFLTFGSYLFSSRVLQRRYSSTLIFMFFTLFFYIVFGFFIFQDSHNIIDYARVNSQLNFGNSVDMNYDVQIKNKAYLVIFATFVCFNFYLLKAERVLFLTVNGLLLIFLKIGFSRADHYLSYFIVPVVLLSLLLAFNSHKYMKLMAVAVLGLMFYMGRMSVYDGAPLFPYLTTHENFSHSFEDRAAERYSKFRLPNDIVAEIGDKTIDVYPYNNEYTVANRLNYVHRPSFQNYMTLTPMLDQLNADFIVSNKAPKYILWTAGIVCADADCPVFDDFDGKYILNEDPLTSMAILNHYKVVRVLNDFNHKPIMLMKKNPDAQHPVMKRTGQLKARFGQWIKIPATENSIVKLVPDFKLTLVAKLQNLLSHGSVLYANYRLSSGEIKRYRLNIINAQSGIWASPMLDALPLKGQRVIEVMFENTDTYYFKPEFNVSFETQPHDLIEVVKPRVSAFVSTKPEGLMDIHTLCDASIDSLEQFSFTSDNVLTKRFKSSGWAAFSIANNLAPQAIWLTLQDEQGHKSFVSVDKVSRTDVANAFNKPNLVNAGYKVFADITQFKGHYKAGLAMAGEGKLIECDNFAQPITIP
ncbi:hypothetical protein [Pantoea anthophila]|uniref:hypothetical protein n=1 Tax=Pantoea anthophila TaxID=470931 RepID=UPI003CF028FF